MLDCAIIFPHYRDDAITRRNFVSLQDNNPYPVVAVHRGSNYMRGSIALDKLPAIETRGSIWRNADAFIYDWFSNRGFDAKRYIYLEWDSFATTAVRSVYDSVWDADAATCRLVKYHDGWDHYKGDWFWFSERDYLPEVMKPHASGCVPLNGTFLSHAALSEIVSQPMPDVFCELRLATLLTYRGVVIDELPAEYQRQNVPTEAWVNGVLIKGVPDRTARGIFHPVKGLDG